MQFPMKIDSKSVKVRTYVYNSKDFIFLPVSCSVLLVLVAKVTITDVNVVAAILITTPIKNFQMLSPIFIHNLNLLLLPEMFMNEESG